MAGGENYIYLIDGFDRKIYTYMYAEFFLASFFFIILTHAVSVIARDLINYLVLI